MELGPLACRRRPSGPSGLRGRLEQARQGFHVGYRWKVGREALWALQGLDAKIIFHFAGLLPDRLVPFDYSRNTVARPRYAECDFINSGALLIFGNELPVPQGPQTGCHRRP